MFRKIYLKNSYSSYRLSSHYHRLSNHPPVIKKQLPPMLATRLLQLSCNSKEFSNAVPEYVEAMQRSGHTRKLEYADNFGFKKKEKEKTKHHVV